MENSYALDALVGLYDPKFSSVQAARHYDIHVVTFGVRRGGPEISQTVKVPAGGVIHLAKIFESMRRPGSISFLMPRDEVRYLSGFKRQKLDLEITFGQYNDQGKVGHESKLYFDDVHLDRNYPDTVNLPDTTLHYERVDMHYQAKPVFTP